MVIEVGACLPMIAGEFDLSVGSMIGFASTMIAIFSVDMGWPIWIAILATFAICLAIGASHRLCLTNRQGFPAWLQGVGRVARASPHPDLPHDELARRSRH